MKSLLLLVFTVLTLTACQDPNQVPEKPQKPELTIYSGITMVLPIQKLAEEFEQAHDVKINIVQGASGFLLKTIKIEKSGDIYFPGSNSFRSQAENIGLFTDHTLVGYNRLALIVPKNNPKHLNQQITQLTDPNLSVVISSPDASSVGRATQKLLEEQGIAKQVFENVTYFTTDSHRIFKAIRNGEADLAINWYATAHWPNTEDYMDAYPIDENLAPKRELELNLLTFSKQKKLALDFIRFASSKHGLSVFHKYGFLTEQEFQQLTQATKPIRTVAQ